MPLLNIPNTLTLLRLCTAPAVAFLITHSSTQHRASVALWLFVAAGALDKLDGMIARRWNQVTGFGAIADPIVDKIWLHTANVALLSIGKIPLWVVAIFLARDFIVAELRGAARRDGASRAAHWLGKMKMRSQTVYTAFCIASINPLLEGYARGIAMFTLVPALYFTMASLLLYSKIYISQVRWANEIGSP